MAKEVNQIEEFNLHDTKAREEIKKLSSQYKDIAKVTKVFLLKEKENNDIALSRIFNEMQSTGGEILFPKGIFELSPFTIPPKITIVGQGQESTVLKLKDGSDSDFITFNQSEYSGLINCTVDGNKENNISGNGIIIKNDNIVNKNSRNLHVENILVKNCAENGIYIKKPNVWIFQIRFVKIDSCNGYGILNEGTDNSFYFIDIYDCKKGGIFESGFNNRWIGGKIYCNGYQSKDTGGIKIFKSSRTTFSDFEVQENYCDGVIIEDSNELSLSNILSDCNGNYDLLHEDPSLYGCAFKFINSRDICLFGGIATSYQNNKQKYGLYIDEDCSNITYSISKNSRYYDSYIVSNANIIDVNSNIIDKTEIGIDKNIKTPEYKINFVKSEPIFDSSNNITGLKFEAGTRLELPIEIYNDNCWCMDFEFELLNIPTDEKILSQIYDNVKKKMYRISILHKTDTSYNIKIHTPGGDYIYDIDCLLDKSYKIKIIKSGKVCRIYINNEFCNIINIYDAIIPSEIGFFGNVSFILKNLKISKCIYGFEYGIDNFTQIYMPLQNDFSYGLGLDYRCQDDKIILKASNGFLYRITLNDKGELQSTKIN